MTTRRLVFPVGVLIIVAAAVVLSAQTPTRSLPPTTPLEDILAEIKGMRADMAESASTTIRTQLLVARLQLQEQRINNVVVQLTELRTQLSGARQAVTAIDNTVRSFQNELQQIAIAPSTPERTAVEQELKNQVPIRQRDLDQARQRVLELVTRESELVSLFSVEQARWSEFNDRLDALEKSLPSRY
jgi:chromosome segregation ATPase